MILGDSSAPRSENDLIDRIHTENPFSRNRVTGTEVQLPDVASINSGPFRDLTELCFKSLEERRGLGAVVVGDAGMGKSHLLARLCRHLSERDETFYAYVHNPQARADALPRYLVKSVLGQLTQGGSKDLTYTPLGRLLRESCQDGDAPLTADPGLMCERFEEQGREIVRNDPSGWHDQDIFHALGLLLASISYPNGQVPIQRKRSRLARLLRLPRRAVSLNTAAVLDWLSGWPISNQRELKGMDLQLDSKGPSSMESVMLAISTLSRAVDRPLVLIFDQVDNLDSERAESLAQFLHALLDHSENLVVIVAGVRERLYDLRDRGLISPAAWDRIAEEEFVLHPIVRREADALVEERLKDFFADFREAPAYVREQKKDWTFPLGLDWLDAELGAQPDFRPRDVITWAKLRWRAQQESLDEMSPSAWLQCWRESDRDPVAIGETAGIEEHGEDVSSMIDAEIERRLEAALQRRKLHPNSLLPDADNMAGLVECLLSLYRDSAPDSGLAEIREPEEGSALSLALRIEGPVQSEEDVGVAFLATHDRNRMSDLLNGVLAEPSPPGRILLVTDLRMPLTPGDDVDRALKELRSRDGLTFSCYSLTFEEHAMLDALASVYSDALSGDVEVVYPDGSVRQVAGEAVLESYHRHEHFLGQRLVRELVEGGAESAAEEASTPEMAGGASPLSEDDVQRYRQHIVSHLALHVGAQSDELARTFRQRYEPDADEGELIARIDSVILGLDEEELVVAEPRDDHYYVEMNGKLA